MNLTKSKAAGLAVVAAGLFAAGCASTGAATGGTQAAAVHCYGVNSCKGQNDCKTASNACKGHGSCKGEGFLGMSASECSSRGGTVGP